MKNNSFASFICIRFASLKKKFDLLYIASIFLMILKNLLVYIGLKNEMLEKDLLQRYRWVSSAEGLMRHLYMQ